MADIFISHSSMAGDQARAFLGALPDELRERGLSPFLDMSALRPGDVWRPILYRELAQCRGAVLVLGPEALSRPWVLQEATILAWRRALREYAGRCMTVVAVLLDGATPDDVPHAFSPLNLGESQFARPEGDTVDAACVLAAQVAGRFPVGRDLEDPLQAWTARVARWLAKMDEFFLHRLAGALDVAPEGDNEQLCDALADALLHEGSFEGLEDALLEVVGSRAPHAPDIVADVVPVAVPAQTAQVLLKALREEPGRRVTAVNSSKQQLAELFVRRATCCDQKLLLVQAPAQMGESEDRLYAETYAAIATVAGANPISEFRPEHLQQVKRPLIVVLQRMIADDDDGGGIPRRVLAPLLDRLRRDFPACVFLVLAGPDYDEDLDLLLPTGLRADPPLDPAEALAWSMAVNRLYRAAKIEVTA